MIHFCVELRVKTFFLGITSQLVILCYSQEKKQMSKTQAKKLSIKFVPYLFVAVTILTALGFDGGTWVWMILSLMGWIGFGLIAF